MKICLIAGNGDLPLEFLKEASNNGNNVFLILIENQADPDLYEFYKNKIILPIGHIGKALSYIKQNNIEKVAFLGGIKRPNLFTIIPDFTGAILLSKILKNKILGDDNILSTVLKFFEDKGISIMPASSFIKNDFQDSDSLTKIAPNIQEIDHILLAKKMLNELSKYDIGQAAIVSDGRIVAIEAAEGTDEMIKRSKNFIGKLSCLVKLPKIGQDTRIDMPTIGPNTINEIIDANISGIAITKDVMIAKKEETISLANKNKKFIYIIKEKLWT